MLGRSEQETISRHRTKLLAGSLLLFVALLPFWSGRLTVYTTPIHFVDWSNGTVGCYTRLPLLGDIEKVTPKA